MKSGHGKAFLYIFVSLAVEMALLGLAYWQYSRMLEKQSLATTLESRLTVTLKGAWIPEDTTALDNQSNPQNASQIGWRIFTPLKTSESLVIVDRGWMPLPPNRTAAPDFTSLAPTSGTVSGMEASFPIRKGWLQGPDTTTHPRILAWLNPANVTSATTEPIYLQATTSTSPNLTAIPPAPSNPNKHASYALQWLAMALIFPILVLYRWRSQRPATPQQ